MRSCANRGEEEQQTRGCGIVVDPVRSIDAASIFVRGGVRIGRRGVSVCLTLSRRRYPSHATILRKGYTSTWFRSWPTQQFAADRMSGRPIARPRCVVCPALLSVVSSCRFLPALSLLLAAVRLCTRLVELLVCPSLGLSVQTQLASGLNTTRLAEHRGEEGSGSEEDDDEAEEHTQRSSTHTSGHARCCSQVERVHCARGEWSACVPSLPEPAVVVCSLTRYPC